MALETVHSIRVRAVDVLMQRPTMTAAGAITSRPLALIDLTTKGGVTARVYVFSYLRSMLAPLARLIETLGAQLVGRPIAPSARLAELSAHCRLPGATGLVGMALSGLDIAMWDALARTANRPTVELIGAEACPVSAYLALGDIDRSTDAVLLSRAAEAGFQAVKIKLGRASAREDIETMRFAREVLGRDVAIMVDFNQALGAVQAVSLLRRLEEFDIFWAEEPAPASDLTGHAQVRLGSSIAVQTGEN
jgi:mandelate racemase